ncbi:cupin domain-containing protein [Candidatus Kaiserbacteria bacterium]|nr:cupin domain-containing protein [Candidatus Kaiserbacteria bacterium]
MQTHASKFDFTDLFTLEMANNHQGSVEHGLKIINEFAKVVKEHGVKATVKLQFRDLDTFIHPADKKKTDNKHVPRFLSTKLSRKDFKILVDATKKAGLISMATPFDEASVELIKELDVDILKIASCSAKDWPLLEKAVTAGKPMIVSLGGMSIPEIDRLVSFLDHRYVHFALMHCVAIYPTPHDKLNLAHIEVLRKRYPGITIGFSTHEEPDNMAAIQIAYAKGARIFERHVGIPTKTITLNAYSSTPEQVSRWIASWKVARGAEGTAEWEADPKEMADLNSLKRGVFAKKPLKKGQSIKRSDVYFAFPYREGQLSSGEFKEGEVVADKAYAADAAVAHETRTFTPTIRDLVYHPIHEVKAMLHTANVALPVDFALELSHHYGLENFRKVGVVIIDVINRDYCKKILVQLPGQEHPYHHHLQKEEAFHVLSGILELELEGRRMTLHPGDIAVVQRGVKHRFWSDTGAIFEEVSSTHFNNDSFYEDTAISQLPREARKTKLSNWGRHHFD